ncbi:MAG: hypothetical protein PHH28_16875 [Desulfuromonadaceae bacterium]|nr:hypothetical protein [Desulfuromonadaceae bacterium]
MNTYCTPTIEGSYSIKKRVCKCRKCSKTFALITPNDNDIIKFKEVTGSEVRWLPTFGKGGYIDLMTKLIDGHKYNDQIDMKKSKQFIIKLQEYIEKTVAGNGFELSIDKTICPQCNSQEADTIDEKILENPDLEWLKISCDLLK